MHYTYISMCARIFSITFSFTNGTGDIACVYCVSRVIMKLDKSTAL